MLMGALPGDGGLLPGSAVGKINGLSFQCFVAWKAANAGRASDTSWSAGKVKGRNLRARLF